jgi:hypothetical protein
VTAPQANMLAFRGLGASTPTWARIATSTASAFFAPLSLFGRFAREYQFATEEDWDGQGAKAVSRHVLQLAERLVSRYGGTEHLVEIAPGRDGAISFVWDDGRGNYIYLDVGPDDTTHLYYDVVGEAKWEGVSVASDPAILSRLRRAFARLYSDQQVVFRFIQTAGSSRYQFRLNTA